MNTRLWTLAALAAAAVSCHKSEAAPETSGPQPPAGQVWLTPQQVKDAKIEVQTIAEQDVDDTILTSGRVTLEDLRSAHVYTPVTGRVVKIVAGLGQRVKKGDALAVIESPDIGNAVSDVHKAEADLIAAEHDFKRKKELFEQKAGSAADQEASEDNWRKATAEVERARQKAYLLRTGNVDNVTQTFTLPSPIDGEVLLMNINPGIEVQGQYSGGATAGALHHRRDRQGLGDRGPVRDGSGAGGHRRARRGHDRRVPREGLQGAGRLGERDARPEHAYGEGAAARSTTPTGCSGPRCT